MIVPSPHPRLARIPIRDTGETLVDVEGSAPLRVAGSQHQGPEHLVTPAAASNPSTS